MKVYLTEEQAEYIRNAKNQEKEVPDMVMFAVNGALDCLIGDSDFNKALLSKGYRHSLDNFKDDISGVPMGKALHKLSRTMTGITKAEADHKSELEQLCCNTVIEMFRIPKDEINFKVELVSEIEPTHLFNVGGDNEPYEYESVDEMDSEDTEVRKRMYINEIVIGASQRLMEQALEECLPAIFKMDEELPHMYSMFVKLNRYLLYANEVEIDDDSHRQGGYVSVRLGDESVMSNIEVKAMNFPILLAECIRGVLELIASNGLPDDRETAKRVIKKADVLVNEPWYERIGYVLWGEILKGRSMESSEIPFMINSLVSVGTDEFMSFMKELSCGTKKAKSLVDDILRSAKYQSEYSDFEKDMADRQDRSMITDEYMSDEELLETDRF